MSSFISKWLPSVTRRDMDRITTLDDKTVPIRAYLNGPDWWQEGYREIVKFFRSPGPSASDDGDSVTIQAATREETQILGLEQQTSAEQLTGCDSDEDAEADAEADEDYYSSPQPFKLQKDIAGAQQISFQPPKDLENVYLNDSMIPPSPLHVPVTKTSNQHVSREPSNNINLPSSAFESADRSYQHTENIPLGFGIDPPSSPPAAVHDQEALLNQAAEFVDNAPAVADTGVDANPAIAPSPAEPSSTPLDYAYTAAFPPFPYSNITPVNDDLATARPVYDVNHASHVTPYATLEDHAMDLQQPGIDLVKKRKGSSLSGNEQPPTKKQDRLGPDHIISDARLLQVSEDDMDIDQPALSGQSSIPALQPHAAMLQQAEILQTGRSSSISDRGKVTKLRGMGGGRTRGSGRVTNSASPEVLVGPTIGGKRVDGTFLPALMADQLSPSATMSPPSFAAPTVQPIILFPSEDKGQTPHTTASVVSKDPALQVAKSYPTAPASEKAPEPHTIQSAILPPSHDMDQTPPTMRFAVPKELTLQTAEAGPIAPAMEQSAPNVDSDAPLRALSRQRKPRGTMSERELFALFPNKGYNDAPADVATRRSGAAPRIERQLLGSWRASDDSTADAAHDTTTGKDNHLHVGVHMTQRSRRSSSSSLSGLATTDVVPAPVTRDFGPSIQMGNGKGTMDPPASRSVSPTKRDGKNVSSQTQQTGDNGEDREEKKEAVEQKRFSTPVLLTPAATSQNTPVRSGTSVRLPHDTTNRASQTAQRKPTRANPTKSPYFPTTATTTTTDTRGMSAQQKGWETRRRKAEEKAAKERDGDHGSEDELALLTPAPSLTSKSTAKPTTTTKGKAKAKGKAMPNTKASATPVKRFATAKISIKASSAATAPAAASKGPARTNSANDRAPPKRMLSELDAPPIADPSPLRTRHASSATISSAPAPAFEITGSGAPPINKALKKRMEDKAKNKCG